MPTLIKLHERFKGKGLTIIAVHNDTADSIEDMENKIAQFRDEQWNGQDLPFLIALDGGGETRIKGINSTKGATTAAYGITGFPTNVLIGPDGKVIEKCNIGSYSSAVDYIEGYLGFKVVEEWEDKFYDVYKLKEGEVLKRISQPFIPERNDYYKNEHYYQAQTIQDPPDYFQFLWNGKLNNYGLGFIGGGTKLRDVLRIMDLNKYDYECSDELLNLNVPGDWILRENSTIEERIKALENILNIELNKHIKFEKKEVEQDVLVAKGTYNFTPISDYNDRG